MRIFWLWLRLRVRVVFNVESIESDLFLILGEVKSDVIVLKEGSTEDELVLVLKIFLDDKETLVLLGVGVDSRNE